MGGAFSAYGEGRRVHRVLVWKSEGKNHLEDPGLDGRINIQIDLREVGCGGMDWMELAQDGVRWWALVNAVMSLRVPYNGGIS